MIESQPVDIERVLRDEIDAQRSISNKMRYEHEIQKARADHWRDLAVWAYHASREALMVPPQRPKEAREARDKALCEINKRLGAAIR